MIVDSYPAVDLFALLPEALRHQDPLLQVLDTVLDDPVLLASVREDVCHRSPHSATRGRSSTPVEVIFRMLVLRRFYDWSYVETVRWVADSISLRQFCRLGPQTVPDPSTLERWAVCLSEGTLAAINARLVVQAQERGLTRGRKLRLDTTVVETTMHYPSDSTLLADGVRVLSRLVGRARSLIDGPARLFRTRTRSAMRRARAISERTRKRGEEGAVTRERLYREVLSIARATVRQSHEIIDRLTGEAPADLRDRLVTMAERTERVIRQTERRLAGESVPAGEKIVSVFEPHTAIIRRDKPRAQTEFGHKVLLAETEGGILTQDRVLEGNAPDAGELDPSLAVHQEQFGHAPGLVTTDRGFWSMGCEERTRAAGVRTVAIPQSGGRVSPAQRAKEKQPWFRRAQRFRAGGEGRISVCKRRGHLGRCRDRGQVGFARWVSWGRFANNLAVIAAHDLAHAS